MEALTEYRDTKPYLNLRLFDANTNTTSSDGMSAEMKTFYSKDLIKNAKPNLIHSAAAQKVNIPKGGGKVIEFRRASSLPKATTPITEGVTPDGGSLDYTNLTATVDQYGFYVTVSDRLVTEAIDPIILNANERLADQAGRTLDTITREVITAGTNAMYVPSVATDGTETEILLRKNVISSCLLRVKDIVNAVTRLKRMNAPRKSGYYLGYIHPDLSGDLQNSQGWLDVHKYDASEEIFAGELGRIGGVRFMESSECKIIGPATISDNLCRLTNAAIIESSATTVYIDEELTPATPGTAIPVYINGVANTITKIEADGTYGSKLTVGTAITSLAVGAMICGQGAGKLGHAVYCTMICGMDAYGETSIEGEGLKFIFHQLGSAGSADPLDQRATIGWKGSKVAERLVEENMIRVESTSEEMGLTAVSN